MEMISGRNPEMVSSGRSRLCLIGGVAVESRRVKRRRRDPSAIALSSSDQQGDGQQQLPQGNHQQTPTATKVKRSSRFRGVSRLDSGFLPCEHLLFDAFFSCFDCRDEVVLGHHKRWINVLSFHYQFMHRWTGRYEAHLWDKGSWNPTQRKKGKQVYLGAYDEEESAARAYDLAAIKYWGTSTITNFPASDYEKEIEIMKTVTKEEYLASLRRRSSGFSRGVSKYRGVARHHHNGRWEARIGRVFANKYLYLGTYGTQEEAAHAYDIAALEYRGINAVTNFDLSTYIRWLKPAGSSYNPPLPPEESKPVLEPLPLGTCYSNQIPRERATQLPFFRPNPFSNGTDDLNSPKPEDNIFPGKPLIGPCTRSSSPTALSLLLKSSIFKELVEKNSSTIEEGTEENETKMSPSAGNNNEVGDYFYNGNSNCPYLNMCPSNQGACPGSDSKYNSSSPLWYSK